MADADVLTHGEASRREADVSAWRPALLADLLQDLARRLPGDSLQAEEADGKPLRQQALEGAVQVLEGKRKKVHD